MSLRKPVQIPPFAEACLEAIAAEGLSQYVSLGGAFALAFYLDYRETHDLDAWWVPSAGEDERGRLISCVANALRRFGEVDRRCWGDVAAIDLKRDGRTVFSFQVAERSVQLEESQVAPLQGSFLIDSLADLIASKMVALIERGAPRDFRDIHALCEAGLSAPNACWELWKKRCDRSGLDSSPSRARLALETHLERIELQRPLSGIAESAGRERAAAVRSWFRKELLGGLVD